MIHCRLRGIALSVAIGAVATLCACAGQISAARPAPVARQSLPSLCPLDVLEPVTEAGALQGNVGGHAEDAIRAVTARMLAIAREYCPSAELVDRLSGSAVLGATIVQWKQMRTDDPIGAVILPHNSIVITRRVMGRKGVSGVQTATYKRQARLTLNQPAERLLGEDFSKAIRTLLSSAVPCGQADVGARQSR